MGINKKYPKYKDSGIEWIGHVPVHWQKRRVESVIDYIVNGVWGEDPVGDENDIVCVRVADFDMSKSGINNANLTQRHIQLSQRNSRTLSENDILIEKSGGGEKQTVGRVVSFDIDEKAVCSNFVGKIALKTDEIVPRFGTYLFSSMYAIGLNQKAIKQTTGIQNLDTDTYFNEYFYMPSKDQQKIIADYLDRKTTQIDDLIARKERMIELLKEERTAIINQAVMRGLDSNVQLKNSGKDWIGKIPNHWRIKKLKHLSNVQTGITPPSDETGYYSNASLDWFTPGDFNDHILLGSSKRKINHLAVKEGVAKIYEPFSVLLVGIGATLGKIGIVDKEASSNQQINAVTFRSIVNPFYGAFYLKSISKIVVSLSNASTLAILNQSQTKDILMVVPPLEEQDAIVDFCKSLDKQSEDVISTEKAEIDYLMEYRTALISEVVTGKVDVRENA